MAANQASVSLAMRVVDIEVEINNSPIFGLSAIPIVSLEEALDRAMASPHLAGWNAHDRRLAITCAKRFGRQTAK